MTDNSRAANRHDVWASGEAYEHYMGRWSRLVAYKFLDWLGVAPGRDWLDVGCGTGALSETILLVAAPRRVRGIDASAAFVAQAQERIQDPRAAFKVGDAQALPEETASCDAAVSALVLNFVPQPGQAAGEMARVTRAGGIAAAYVWDYAGKMEMIHHFWDAVTALDPNVAELHEAIRFPLCLPEPLTKLFQDAGLENVEVQGLEISTDFKNFDDFWSPFLGGQGPASAYVMSLTQGKRDALRDRIRAGLPIAADGSISLKARAWAVRGFKA